MTIFNVISLAGGLALFLYGMSIMGTGLEKYAGGRMESILQKLTSSTWRAVALGAVITALIQSSWVPRSLWWALSTRASCSFPSSSSWANVGTTVTGQIIRLSMFRAAAR
ncbi:MAG: Na/Pi symporter [Ruthenibacterium lactatiformans]